MPYSIIGLPTYNRSKVARLPVFQRSGRYFTASLAEAGKKPVFW